jgi:hypothetical protein
MYHLCKQSRAYEGKPYCGPSSDGIPQEYSLLSIALKAKELLTKRNPVGWNIYDSETGKLVDGQEFHG